MLWSQSNLEGLVWSHQSIGSGYLKDKLPWNASFWQLGLLDVTFIIPIWHHTLGLLWEEKWDIIKIKFVKLWDWLAYSERTRRIQAPCQKSGCQWWVTSVLLCSLWWVHKNPCYIESSEHKCALISRHQYTITGWFSTSGHFTFCSFWICQPILWFDKLVFVTSSLLFSNWKKT